MLLNLGLPKRDDLDMLSRLRARKDQTPVLIASARDVLEQHVQGLDLGADDYKRDMPATLAWGLPYRRLISPWLTPLLSRHQCT